MTKAPNVGGPTPPVETPSQPVIRPLYGVFIADDLAKFRQDIQGTINTINQGLKDHDPELKTRTDIKNATDAARQLKVALSELKSQLPWAGVAGNSTLAQPAVAAAGGGVGPFRPLYGLFIQHEVAQAKTQIQNEINEINAALQKNAIKDSEKAHVNLALGDLNRALAKLNLIAT